MPVYDDRIDRKILRALFEKKKINFNGFGYLGITKAPRRRHLNRLEASKLIRRDKTASWRSGQSINYTLTDKGVNRYIQESAEDVSQALRTLTGILDEWYNKPEFFKKYRKKTCIVTRMDTDSSDDDIALPEIKRRLEDAIQAFDILQITLDFHIGPIREKKGSTE